MKFFFFAQKIFISPRIRQNVWSAHWSGKFWPILKSYKKIKESSQFYLHESQIVGLKERMKDPTKDNCQTGPGNKHKGYVALISQFFSGV